MKRIMEGMNGDKIATILSEMPKTAEIPIILYSEDDDPQTGARFINKTPNIHNYLTSCDTPTATLAIRSALKS
ncbi:hypothetical protein ACFLS1_11080 [Verrucomicrobiota bacterium]